MFDTDSFVKLGSERIASISVSPVSAHPPFTHQLPLFTCEVIAFVLPSCD